MDNLVLLCRRHHKLLHEGGYLVERLSAGKLRFRYPWGEPLPDAPRPPPGSLNRLLERNERPPVGADSYRSGAGDRMDLDLTVKALLAA